MRCRQALVLLNLDPLTEGFKTCRIKSFSHRQIRLSANIETRIVARLNNLCDGFIDRRIGAPCDGKTGLRRHRQSHNNAVRPAGRLLPRRLLNIMLIIWMQSKCLGQNQGQSSESGQRFFQHTRCVAPEDDSVLTSAHERQPIGLVPVKGEVPQDEEWLFSRWLME